MPEIDLKPDELAALFAENREASNEESEANAWAHLFEAPSPPNTDIATSPMSAAPPAARAVPVQQHPGEYTWDQALHLVPGFEQLFARYPAIGLMQHAKHGLVLVAAYLEDCSRRVRRNLKLGDDLFFDTEELELIEPETKHLQCRVIVKILKRQVGMRIRYWENTPVGDAAGRSGTFVVTERGLVRSGRTGRT